MYILTTGEMYQGASNIWYFNDLGNAHMKAEERVQEGNAESLELYLASSYWICDKIDKDTIWAMSRPDLPEKWMNVTNHPLNRWKTTELWLLLSDEDKDDPFEKYSQYLSITLMVTQD